MPTFVYTAANNQGEIMNGELVTDDMKTVLDYLNRQELMIISVKPKDDLMEKLETSFFFSLSMSDKIMLTKHLGGIIKSGLSLKEGVEVILNDTEVKPLKRILTDAKLNLEKGQPLSVTFRSYPDIFSPVFIAFIEAGEISGTLDKSLDYLGLSLSREYEMSRKVKAAMVYPAVLVFASIAVITVLMVLVVPKLIRIFNQSNAELPWLTKMIVGLSSMITANLFAIVSILVLVFFSFLYFRKKRVFKDSLSRIILMIPLISGLYQKMILARFTRVFGTLLASGIGILQALDISAEAIGYNRYQEVIKSLNSEMARGVSLSNALKKQGKIFPHMLSSMVNVGEKTGKLDVVLMDLAGFYEEEVDNSLKNVVSLIEPALLLVMGLVVAAIAFAIITPIYQLIGTVK